MIDLAFKNITRRKARTILTILGIAIGIAAIIALGSISEGLNEMMQKGLELVAGRIMVFQGEGGESFAGMMMAMFTSEITEEHIEKITEIPDVKDVVPLMFYMEELTGFTQPDWYGLGMDPEEIDYFKGENIEMEEGRPLEEGDTNVAIIGKRVSDKFDLSVGDSFSMKEREFEIVGILERSDIEDVDTAVIITMDDMKDILDEDTYRMIYVILEDIEKMDDVVEQIEDIDDELYAISSKDIGRQAGKIIGQIRFFTIGIGGVAAVVGGLGVMNTMIMSVMERRREIGTLKALGGTNKFIMTQILTESGVISFLGGVLGLIIGILVVFLLNTISGGQAYGLVTPGLSATGIIFALFLGIMGGLYPAHQASRLSPMEALRYE